MSDPSLQLTDEQLASFRRAFELFDRNGDGAITPAELDELLRSFGHDPTDAEVRELVDMFDADGNGSIDYPEFVALMASEAQQPRDPFRDAFDAVDTNVDGFISVVELHRAMMSLGRDATLQQAEAELRIADSDADGMVTYEEFLRVVR